MKTEFLKYLGLELNRSGRTVEEYGKDLDGLATFLGLDDELTGAATITTADIRGWLAEMARGGLAPRSLRRKTQAARAFFKWMQRRGLIDINPAQEIQLAKTGRKLPQFVREQEMELSLIHISEPTRH